MFELLNEKWKIKELTNNIWVYGSIKYYKNIKSPECIELKTVAENFYSEINLNLCFIDKKILSLGKEKVERFISLNSDLEIYRLYLDNLFRVEEHVVDSDTSKLVKENIDKINKELTLYNSILKDVEYGNIMIEGEEIEITSFNFAKYLSSKDRETRKQTYLLINEKFKEKDETFAQILDTIIGCRIENTKLEKYGSVLQKALFEENIDPNIITSLIKAVNNNLNLIQRYLKIKSSLLQIEEPHLYDFGVPLSNDLQIKFTLEEAIEIIKNALKPLGKEYIETVDYLLNNGHVDAVPNDSKHQTIIFSWNVYSFLSFRGSYGDLKNLIHELGHIVNYYLSKNKLPFIYEDSTVFVGETASIVNEILLNRYLYEHATSEEERIFYLSKEIENYFTSVFKQTMYTEFENYLYNEKMSNPLTSQLLSKKYEELIKKYYGRDIAYDDICNIEWTRLGHTYRWSYYSYKYATGLIIASVVVTSLLNEHLSKEQYLSFLSAGSSLYSLDLLKMLNIDLTSSNLIDNGFEVLEKDIDELEKSLKRISK